MSSFDAERGVMVLEPEQWDVLQRMVTGPVAQRADYAEGVLVGLEEIGVIDPYGPTLMVSTSTAVMTSRCRISLWPTTISIPVPWLMTVLMISMTRWLLRCVWRMSGPLRPTWMLSAMAGRGPLSSCGTLVTGGGRSCFTAGRTGTGMRVSS